VIFPAILYRREVQIASLSERLSDCSHSLQSWETDYPMSSKVFVCHFISIIHLANFHVQFCSCCRAFRFSRRRRESAANCLLPSNLFGKEKQANTSEEKLNINLSIFCQTKQKKKNLNFVFSVTSQTMCDVQ